MKTLALLLLLTFQSDDPFWFVGPKTEVDLHIDGYDAKLHLIEGWTLDASAHALVPPAEMRQCRAEYRLASGSFQTFLPDALAETRRIALHHYRTSMGLSGDASRVDVTFVDKEGKRRWLRYVDLPQSGDGRVLIWSGVAEDRHEGRVCELRAQALSGSAFIARKKVSK